MPFFPDPFSILSGVHVIETATNRVLAGSPLRTGRPPWDLTVVRRTPPGEARDLQVAGRDPATGALALAYPPACGASSHNIVHGPLEQIRSYGCSGQMCGIGPSEVVQAFDPGEGSFFFAMAGRALGERAGPCIEEKIHATQ